MLLQQRLQTLGKEGKAILAANFYNFETLSGILKAAQQSKESIVLQLSESSIEYLGLRVAASLARSAMEQYGVQAWLHLDHGSSIEIVHRCLDSGFDSVMIDASEKPLAENIRITSEVVQLASRYQANVEAELGYIAKLGQQQRPSQYTQPEEAKTFVEATGVNALAVAVGTAHGFYKETPVLQLELINEIRKATTAALVLHGGSGIPNSQLRQAIAMGISKVNLATDTKNIFMKTLQHLLAQTDEIDLRKIFPRATQSVTELIAQKIAVVARHGELPLPLGLLNDPKITWI